MNQVTAHSGSNPLPVTFWGKISEPATVTVNAQAASVDANNRFRVTLNQNAGNQTNTIVATDYGAGSGNKTTNKFAANPVGGTNRTLLYDANGNLTNQVVGATTTTYEWDAEDRLTAVVTGTQRSEFTYDGFSRRMKIVEKVSGVTQSTKQFIWVGGSIAEERDGSNVVQKKFYPFGEWRNGVGNLYYARDHLGNLRELTDNANTVRARYDYDPYGRRTKVSGDLEADWGFTGHYYHANSGLHLAWFRAYDANLGRWISRDPIEENGGLNLYTYVENDPILKADPLGLWTFGGGLQGQGGAGGGGGVSIGFFIGHSKEAGWSFGILGDFSGGLYLGAGGAVSLFGQVTNAKCVRELKGGSGKVGGSVGELVTAGGDFVFGMGSSGYGGLEGSLGIGGGFPAEAHAMMNFTGGIP